MGTVLCLISIAGFSRVYPASGAPRSLTPKLLATLECNQASPAWSVRTLSSGREVRIVSRRIIDLEKDGQSLNIEYLTDFNIRRERCQLSFEAWDLLMDLREEAEASEAWEIRATVMNDRIGMGKGCGIVRGSDGRWSPEFGFPSEWPDCQDFRAAEFPYANLLVAVMSEDVPGARELLLKGEDVEGTKELERCKDVDCEARGIEALGCSMTPLNYAAYIGDPDMVALLLRAGASVNAVPPCGTSPLGAAAVGGHSDIFKMLLARDADLESTNPMGETPLMVAARNGNGRGVRMLLEAGADVNASDLSGRTPIMYALMRPSVDREPERESADCYQRIIQILMSAGADPDAKDQGGKSLHDLALEKNDATLLKLLSEAPGR